MNNFSYILVLIAGVALVFLGMDIRDKDIENSRLEEEEKLNLILDAEIEESKSKWYINHDNDPKTMDYDIKLTAIGLDPENDEMTYSWKQIAVNKFEKGSDVELSNYDEAITYFTAKSGTYNFQVTVTDAYGDSAVATQIVEINAEPNSAPTVKITVENESEPKPKNTADPFDGDVDKIKKFQKDNGLTEDGKWGPESQEVYDKLNPKPVD